MLLIPPRRSFDAAADSYNAAGNASHPRIARIDHAGIAGAFRAAALRVRAAPDARIATKPGTDRPALVDAMRRRAMTARRAFVWPTGQPERPGAGSRRILNILLQWGYRPLHAVYSDCCGPIIAL